MLKTTVIIFFFLILDVCAQTIPGTILRFGGSNAPFPHALRSDGYVYKEKKYPAATHYQDSTILVYIPTAFKKAATTDIVVYFHGWYNSIDSACAQFAIIEQFENSGINAILIFPEGPKFAPDSFGGKLEDKGNFSLLIQEVLDTLSNKGYHINSKVGEITLAGHSGAFQVIAFILLKGGLAENIRQVFLFDALYGHTEKYVHWMQDKQNKFIAIYTNNGGTLNATNNLIDFLSEIGMPVKKIEEDTFSVDMLTDAPAVFIHSQMGHNDVIAKHQQFRKFLESI